MPATFPLTTFILPSNTLSNFPELPDLFALLNRTYTHAHLHGTDHPIFPDHVGRLSRPDQLATEIGSEGFCIVAFSATEEAKTGKLIGTASAKPYHAEKSRHGASGEVNLMFKRPTPVQCLRNTLAVSGEGLGGQMGEDALPAWELLAMAVEPELQGKGISTQLLNLALDEIRKRVALETKIENTKVTILISTMKELNEGYYLKRGWKTTEERRFPPGTGGSPSGFTVNDMVRVI